MKLRSLSGHQQQQDQSALVFLEAELKAWRYQILTKCTFATAATATGDLKGNLRRSFQEKQPFIAEQILDLTHLAAQLVSRVSHTERWCQF